MADLSLPILGVIGHHRLRERGMVEMMREVRVAAIAPPDSPLLQIADFACPISSLDAETPEIEKAIRNLISRGVPISALISWRDHNVLGVAEIANRLGLRSHPVSGLRRLCDKVFFRRWCRRHRSILPCRYVEFAAVPPSSTPKEFAASIHDLSSRISRTTNGNPKQLILKPSRGSCSQLIHVIEGLRDDDIGRAWKLFRSGRKFRGGTFILEERIIGREISVDTVFTDRVVKSFITAYLEPRAGEFYAVGAVVPAIPEISVDQKDQISKLCGALHSQLELKNIITHMEVILPDDGSIPAIVELNPRMGGGMIQEMHRIVTGANLYRIAAKMAVGEEIDAGLLTGIPEADCAVSRFLDPLTGRVEIAQQGVANLQHPSDRLSLLVPDGSLMTGGHSDDDLTAWTMAAGHKQRGQTIENLQNELKHRADDLFKSWLVVSES